MTNLFYVGLGGGLGSMARYLVSLTFIRYGWVFPWQTLTVNIVGSLLMGVFFILNEKQMPFLNGANYFFLTTGLLGGFTTFSAFSMETIDMFRQGHILQAFVNIILSVVFCLFGSYLGVWLTQKISS